MALDPFADEPRRIVSGHEIGQDLSMLSVDELDERLDRPRRKAPWRLQAPSSSSARPEGI
jgi:uncharacterized small protein (DUF1192 family)